ncbi:MAG: hypothetical protein M3Z04_15260 [Chloroflexota bacterium]|nr:hypothetical protein [Chloroflexota bacterium]
MDCTCPVCGYDKLADPPTDYNICECCGTEFGYHDARRTHGELRQQWIAAGMKWHYPLLPPPPNWNPLQQLAQAGLRETRPV